MRFFDALKMALHNIWHNKSRTMLTVIIVLIVGTLLMVLNIFSISFYNNMNDISREIFNEKGTEYSFNGYWSRSGSSNSQYFTSDEIDVFTSAVQEYSDVIDSANFGYVYCNLSTQTGLDENSAQYVQTIWLNDTVPQLTTFSLPLYAKDDYILAGRAWNKNDSGKDYAWLSDIGVEEIFKKTNVVLDAGDQLSMIVNSYDYELNVSTTTIKQVTIMGIIDSDKILGFREGESLPGLYIDISLYIGMGGINQMYGLSLSYKPSASEYDFASMYARIEQFEDTINSSSKVRKQEGNAFSAMLGMDKRFSSDITSSMSLTRMMGGMVLGLIMAISLVIVLLSAGSIANSIIISTDKNKKFIGLMKALGLKNKDVNRIINLEAALQIFIGVAVSFVALLLIDSLVLQVLNMALGAIFRSMSQGVEFTLTLYMPVYIPIAVFAVFLSFALLSARGSLRQLGKMDVIAIMSEAA